MYKEPIVAIKKKKSKEALFSNSGLLFDSIFKY